MFELEHRLKGTRGSHIMAEFFGNAVHFPLLNIFYELYRHGPTAYLSDPDPYLLMIAAISQAIIAGSRCYRGRCLPLLGNLAGPGIYTLAEMSLEGTTQFFSGPQHLAYWYYALAIGLIQLVRHQRPASILLVMEHLVRTSMLLTLYILLEQTTGGPKVGFLGDPSHLFIITVIPLIGLALGFAALNAERYLEILRETTDQFQRYSEWLLGKELLSQAVADPRSLILTRRRRAVLFFDIRGFTWWCERHAPEEVVTMVNAYYDVAEPIWLAHKAIKVKLTADEIMLVMSTTEVAVSTARAMAEALPRVLGRYGLAAGAGLHVGPVIEGLLGATGRKEFDVLGDTVNVAKRLCQAAGHGEILLSREALEEASAPHGQPRALSLKGKRERVVAYPLEPLEPLPEPI